MQRSKKQRRFIKGDDFKEKDASYKTYGITDRKSQEKDLDHIICHENKIEIYGDRELRNKVLKLLHTAENF